MRCISEGENDARICELLGIKLQTVKNTIQAIEQRLGVNNRTSIAVYALTGYLPASSGLKRKLEAGKRLRMKDYELGEIDFTQYPLGGFENG